MKRLYICIMTFILLFSLTACGRKNEFTLGTGDIGGNYYSYANALTGLIKDETYKTEVKTTAGSAANLRLMQNGFLDTAIVQSDILLDAYNGTGMFKNNKCSGIRAIAGLYMEDCQIIVKADSDIYSIEDLYNKNVSIGEEQSGVRQNAEQILLANGITLGRIVPFYMSFSDSATALRNGQIDAFFCTAGSPTTAVNELSKEIDIRLISLDEKTCEKLIKDYPCYAKSTIPAGTYKGQDNDVTTLGVKAVLVASNNVPDDYVNYITDTLFNHAKELQYATSASALDAAFATTAIPVPFHNAAAKWYKNNNIDVETSAEGNTNYGVNAKED